MKALTTLLLLGLACCAGPAPKRTSEPRALSPVGQEIVQQVAAKHSGVARLTLHAIPTGTAKARVVASTSPAKLGSWSDPEDLQVMATKTPVALMEGANLDYTAPIVDGSGNAIATVGVTLAGGTSAGKEAETARAREIAAEVGAAVLAAGKPLW